MKLTRIASLCPSGVTAGGFGELAIDLTAIVAVKGSEPGLVKVWLAAAALPLRLTASCADRQRYPAHELAAAITKAANKARK